MAKGRTRVRLSKLLSYVGCARPEVEEIFGEVGFQRVVHCNEPERHVDGPHAYCSNYISTTKYNWYNYLPKSLFEQFRRVANLYFLLCAVLAVTPLSPYTAFSLIAPLVLVVGVSMIKEAVEDWRRWAADQEVNNRSVLVHAGQGVFEPRPWKSVRVGDVVKVIKDEYFPADLLLLSSSYPDGICYVETMNLDGETNLKLRKALERTLDLDEDGEMGGFHAEIACEDPNPSLYTFIGNLDWSGETSALGPQQVLLRDSKLRNTGHIYGIAVFTGHDTKVMQNSSEVPSKRSRIERRMDSVIYLLFATLLVMAIVGSIVFGIRTSNDSPAWWYLEPWDSTAYYDPNRSAVAATLQAITAVILYGYLIPISLYVSIEIVKVFQALFISMDYGMYHAETDKPARARTSNLNEELGQVDTVLSDKTGTLTCNQMEFLKCTIAGVAYGRGVTEVERAAAKRLGRPVEELEDGEGEGEKQQGPKVKGFALQDARITNGNWVKEPHADTIRMFLRILAVCHTVIPEEDGGEAEEEDGTAEAEADSKGMQPADGTGNGNGGHIKYEAESPDEAAFVEAARQFGFEFVRRTQTSVFVREQSLDRPGELEEREYSILNLIEFNSTRKRMSVVVRDPEGQVYLFCKGADSVIYDRLSASGREYADATRDHLQRYGEAGLRTLALAYRLIEEDEYAKWAADFLAAKTSLGADREARLDAAAEDAEKDLTLLGATAVEDKLQKGVPGTIDRLAQAGIKIWVLTGDKVETAINIGFACSLLRDDMTQIVISLDTPDIRKAEETGGKDKEALKAICADSVRLQIERGAALVDAALSGNPRDHEGHEGQEADEDDDEDDQPSVFALVIDGKSLLYALEGSLQPQLLALAMQCASVICCRVSPKQKALITRLVKEGTGRTTLGIGDGANDVGMIHEADIGVGISGVEGQQAVMASDFAIAQFAYLERLLLMHGHWCYKRIACMVTYFFFKNIAFGLTIFYYNAYAVFSGQILYNSWACALYNVVFTSLPVIGYGALEQDVSAKTCFMFPGLYQQGPRNTFFSWKRIVTWMANGLFMSVICFWFPLLAFNPQALKDNGKLPEMAGLAGVAFTSVVIAVNLQIALFTQYWTWITHLFIWGSIAVWYLFVAVYGAMSSSFSTDWYRLFTEVLFPSPMFWLSSLLVPVAALLPYLSFKAVQTQLAPMDQQIVQELVKVHADEEAARSVIPPLRVPVGFTATVEAVAKRIARKERRRRRGGR